MLSRDWHWFHALDHYLSFFRVTGEQTPTLEFDLEPRFWNRQRQPGLDLLRALAIIVVIYHAGSWVFRCPLACIGGVGSV
jgi:hypothetical protein